MIQTCLFHHYFIFFNKSKTLTLYACSHGEYYVNGTDHVFTGLFKEMGTQEIPTSSSAPNNSEIQVQIQENMRSEAQRLSTFTSWPHNDKVEARKIAKAGFFHTGIGTH